MLIYGNNLGFRIVVGATQELNDFDALRPPHTDAAYFKRTMSSSNWKPIPFGNEGTGVTAVSCAILFSSAASSITSVQRLTAEQASIGMGCLTASLTQQHRLTADAATIRLSSTVADATIQLVPVNVTSVDASLSISAVQLSISQQHRIASVSGALTTTAAQGQLIQEHRLAAQAAASGLTASQGAINAAQRLISEDASLSIGSSEGVLAQLHRIMPDDAALAVATSNPAVTIDGAVPVPVSPPVIAGHGRRLFVQGSLAPAPATVLRQSALVRPQGNEMRPRAGIATPKATGSALPRLRLVHVRAPGRAQVVIDYTERRGKEERMLIDFLTAANF